MDYGFKSFLSDLRSSPTCKYCVFACGENTEWMLKCGHPTCYSCYRHNKRETNQDFRCPKCDWKINSAPIKNRDITLKELSKKKAFGEGKGWLWNYGELWNQGDFNIIASAKTLVFKAQMVGTHQNEPK